VQHPEGRNVAHGLNRIAHELVPVPYITSSTSLLKIFKRGMVMAGAQAYEDVLSLGMLVPSRPEVGVIGAEDDAGP
jgi:hypothetical protein